MKKQIFYTVILTMLACQISLAKDIIVSTTADSGAGSLRAAIIEANHSEGLDKIIFNIPMTDRGYLSPEITGQKGWAFFIRLENELPQVTERVIIDGASQTRFTGNTNAAVPGKQIGAEVIIFHHNSMQSWQELEHLTASNVANSSRTLYMQNIELMNSLSHQNKSAISKARGGKLPMR